MASGLYNRAKKNFGNGTFDWDTHTFLCLLVTASYTPNPDHNVVTDITNELSGTGYSRKTLANCTVTQDDTNDRSDYAADNVTWTGINAGTPARAIICKDGANDGARELVGWIEFTATATNGGDFTLKWNNGSSSGVLLRLA